MGRGIANRGRKEGRKDGRQGVSDPRDPALARNWDRGPSSRADGVLETTNLINVTEELRKIGWGNKHKDGA